jgi:aquaporin related protein
MPEEARNILVVIIGEFCGTFMFLLLSYIGAQTAIKTNAPLNPDAPLLPFSLMYIASSFGGAIAVNVWIFYRVTGGMFNPAVTLGLVLVGAVKPMRGLFIFPTQIVAGIAAAAVTKGLLPGPLVVGNTLGDDTSVVRGLFIEMFLTSQLVLTVYFLAVEKHRATFLAPIGVGIAVFIAHICGTNYTGTGINPARSFGPDVVTSFPGYHWIYWLGPFMGSFLAFGCYSALKILEYTTANPGQDDGYAARVKDEMHLGNSVASSPAQEKFFQSPQSTAMGGNGHARTDSAAGNSAPTSPTQDKFFQSPHAPAIDGHGHARTDSAVSQV